MSRSKSTWKRNNHPEKNKLDADSLRKNHNGFIKNKRLILKSQPILRSEKHNVFTEEDSIDSIDSIET